MSDKESMTLFESRILSIIRHSFNAYIDRNALFINNAYYSYRSLAIRISAIRNEVHSWKSSERVVALAVHDDLDTYASILALWMEGKAYSPLHPNQPVERNRAIISQISASFLLDSEGSEVFSDLCQVVNTSGLKYEEVYIDQWIDKGDDELAYILFTSGSTGVPKGVQISRRNVASFMDSFWRTGIEVFPDDRCLQLFDLTFDVSVQSFLVAFCRGACLYTVPYGQVKYLYAAALIQEQRISFGAMAPSMLTYLRPYFEEFDASSLKTCILTAEACPTDLLEAWFKCARNTTVYDFYGPTEATIYCTFYKLSREGGNLSLNGTISIGKPLANVNAIIIREDGSLVEGEQKGELCVAGPQVTPGYWKNPEKNAMSFFIWKGERYYHTGDLCYWDQSGNIMYSGRIDQQAKIQGFRVELGEIEYYARLYYSNMRRVIAIAFQNAQNLTEIALFIEAMKEDVEPLIKFLRGKLPHYMIPSRFLFETHFPLNNSEKVDRNTLKQRL